MNFVLFKLSFKELTENIKESILVINNSFCFSLIASFKFSLLYGMAHTRNIDNDNKIIEMVPNLLIIIIVLFSL
jgi:hypothetical protein